MERDRNTKYFQANNANSLFPLHRHFLPHSGSSNPRYYFEMCFLKQVSFKCFYFDRLVRTEIQPQPLLWQRQLSLWWPVFMARLFLCFSHTFISERNSSANNFKDLSTCVPGKMSQCGLETQNNAITTGETLANKNKLLYMPRVKSRIS